MTRRLVVCVLVSLLTALLAPVPGLATQAGPHASAATPRTAVQGRDAPVTLHQVQPSSLQQDRPVNLSGVVRNTTDSTWSKVQVSMVISESPLSTPEALAEARTERESIALRQVLQPGDFDELGDLESGEQASFSVRNDWDALPVSAASGAYVVGVEVRAFEEDGLRSTVAQTSTFVPLVGADTDPDPVRLGMVLPLTARVPRLSDGYANDSLNRQFAENGRLSALTEFGASAGDFPLSWVVDPAVLDSAHDMSDGYQLEDEGDVAEDDDRAVAAANWLQETRSALSGQDLLTLPYGDPDITSLARARQGEVLSSALAAGESTLAGLDLPQRSLLWPARGWMNGRSLGIAGRIAPSVALLADDSLRGSDPPATFSLPLEDDSATSALSYDRSQVSPLRTETTLQWRQQLLSVAALQAMQGGGTMVAAPRHLILSSGWAASDFFGGLNAPWLRPTALSALAGGDGSSPGSGGGSSPDSFPGLHYPGAAPGDELPERNQTAVGELTAVTRTLIGVLTDPEDTEHKLGEAAGIASSVRWRDDPGFGHRLTSDYVSTVRDRIDAVRVEAPPLITLSGREGQFPLTVSNGLRDEAITVSVEVGSTNDAMRVEPVEQVTIEPEQRRSIPVQAHFPDEVGISTVTVRLLDRNGASFGESVQTRVRTTQIGTVIWVVMAIGGAIIFAAAIRSIVRRVRAREGRETARGGDNPGGRQPGEETAR